MKLTFKKGKQDKIHISIDSEYALTVDETYFAALGFYQGQEIDDEQYEALREKVSVRRAYNYAVSLLSRRDHSESELLFKLKQKGYENGSFEAIEKLKSQGYVDDLRFAHSFTKELIRLKGYAKGRIKQELYRKGINNEIISQVLDETEFPEDKLTEIIERKYKRYLNDEKGVKKTVNALLRMGYSYSEIRSALKEIQDTEEFFSY